MRHAGPNVHGISPDIPKGCAVEQAAYVVRHGSRYPDKGAYGEWVEMEEKVGIPSCAFFRLARAWKTKPEN